MSIPRSTIISALSPPLPLNIIEHLVDEYLEIKKHLALGKFSPTELNGGRFAECVLRLLQHLQGVPITPFGQQLSRTDELVRDVGNNPSLHASIRFYISKMTRVMLDVRNRRDVAHVGGDVSPNYSDSLFISHNADWILTELVRIYFQCSISEARKIVENINQIHVPVVFNFNGFLKIQNSKLPTKDKILTLLYYKYPDQVLDNDLQKWIKYSNSSRFKKEILNDLDVDAYIHYERNLAIITPKGVQYVEKNISLEIVI
jgi:hypothetical protein